MKRNFRLFFFTAASFTSHACLDPDMVAGVLLTKLLRVTLLTEHTECFAEFAYFAILKKQEKRNLSGYARVVSYFNTVASTVY